MSSWLIYWILMLDNLKAVGCGIIVIAFLITVPSIIAIIFNLVVSDDEKLPPPVMKIVKRVLKCGIGLAILSFIINAFLPSTKQMAVIYILPKLSYSQELTKIPNKLLKLSNEFLDQQINKEK